MGKEGSPPRRSGRRKEGGQMFRNKKILGMRVRERRRMKGLFYAAERVGRISVFWVDSGASG